MIPTSGELFGSFPSFACSFMYSAASRTTSLGSTADHARGQGSPSSQESYWIISESYLQRSAVACELYFVIPNVQIEWMHEVYISGYRGEPREYLPRYGWIWSKKGCWTFSNHADDGRFFYILLMVWKGLESPPLRKPQSGVPYGFVQYQLDSPCTSIPQPELTKFTARSLANSSNLANLNLGPADPVAENGQCDVPPWGLLSNPSLLF